MVNGENTWTIPKLSVKRLMLKFTHLHLSDPGIEELVRTLELIVEEVVREATRIAIVKKRKRVSAMDILMAEKQLKHRLDRII